jgi:hypothetical protein
MSTSALCKCLLSVITLAWHGLHSAFTAYTSERSNCRKKSKQSVTYQKELTIFDQEHRLALKEKQHWVERWYPTQPGPALNPSSSWLGSLQEQFRWSCLLHKFYTMQFQCALTDRPPARTNHWSKTSNRHDIYHNLSATVLYSVTYQDFNKYR